MYSRRGIPVRTAAAGLVAVLGVLASPVAPVGAQIAPTVYDARTDRPPEDTDPRPPVPMEQKTVCATSAVIPDSQFHTIPASSVFRVDDLHRFATGRGQTVAVIDSGVTPNARLPRLVGAGDYVAGGDGLSDCDHHGTLIAGIIGAQPAQNDTFIGVAPDASIVSLRQTSGAFGPERSEDREVSGSTLSSLAKAIVRAANHDATVINLSVTACVPANAAVDLSELRGALHYAAVERDAVVVSSAGNVDQTCEANLGPDPEDPLDPLGWDQATTVSLPSYIDQYVLSVGGSTLTGDIYENTMPGPWVDVSAPAVNIVSLDPVAGDRGGLINAEVTRDGTAPISGTSFASAYVSGLAALIRERYPHLSALQVRNRIINSAHLSAVGLNNHLGFGPVDPFQALTGDVSTEFPSREVFQSQQLEVPPRAPEKDMFPIYMAIAIMAMLGITAMVYAILTWFRTPENHPVRPSDKSKKEEMIDA